MTFAQEQHLIKQPDHFGGWLKKRDASCVFEGLDRNRNRLDNVIPGGGGAGEMSAP